MSTEISNTQASPENEETEVMPSQHVTVPFPDAYIYSNASSLSTSFVDVRIGFAEVLPDAQAHVRVGVVVPPEHAAQLVLNLLKQLHFFETKFGQIRNPEWQAFKERGKANAEVLQKALSISKPSQKRKTNL